MPFRSERTVTAPSNDAAVADTALRGAGAVLSRRAGKKTRTPAPASRSRWPAARTRRHYRLRAASPFGIGPRSPSRRRTSESQSASDLGVPVGVGPRSSIETHLAGDELPAHEWNNFDHLRRVRAPSRGIRVVSSTRTLATDEHLNRLLPGALKRGSISVLRLSGVLGATDHLGLSSWEVRLAKDSLDPGTDDSVRGGIRSRRERSWECSDRDAESLRVG